MTSYDITTYTGLSNAIQAFSECTEPTFIDNIPNFVQNAERLINNTVQLPAFKKAAALTATVGSPYLTLPTDFLAMFSLAAIDGTGQFKFLLNKDINYIRECFPYPAVKGLPTTYALYNTTQFFVGPTPDATYSFDLQYFGYPASIVTAGSTWVSLNFPNVLLYGALHEAYVYQKGENDLLQTYKAKFDEAMSELKQLGDGKDRRDAYRTVQVRDQVV